MIGRPRCLTFAAQWSTLAAQSHCDNTIKFDVFKHVESKSLNGDVVCDAAGSAMLYRAAAGLWSCFDTGSVAGSVAVARVSIVDSDGIVLISRFMMLPIRSTLRVGHKKIK